MLSLSVVFLSRRLARVEIGREVGTIVLLAVVGWLYSVRVERGVATGPAPAIQRPNDTP